MLSLDITTMQILSEEAEELLLSSKSWNNIKENMIDSIPIKLKNRTELLHGERDTCTEFPLYYNMPFFNSRSLG